MATSTLTSTIYAPLIPMLSSRFAASVQAIDITVTVYAIFQALSPALFASLADSFGRRPVLLFLIALYAIASLGLTLNQHNHGALLGLRALQSIGGSATVPIAYGIVADVAVLSERGRMLGPMLATCNAISTVGPIVGGVVAMSTGRATWGFFALLVLALLLFVLAGFTLPETARGIVGNGSEQAHGMWQTWDVVFRQSRREERRRGEKENKGKDDVPTEANEADRQPWRPSTIFASLRINFFP